MVYRTKNCSLKMIKQYVKDLRLEFKGYNGNKFGKDLFAGLTVTAVALPLALAFGVSSGANAAAGLVTAIIAGLIISLFSGASYQISGPTGAMTAILFVVVTEYKLQGVFIAGVIAGLILLICGFLKLGKLVYCIPKPVVTGFTSGIAIIIILGQLDNILGMKLIGENSFEKIVYSINNSNSINLTTIVITICVILFMVFFPKKLNKYFPSSLAVIIICVIFNYIFNFNVPTIGEIPKTIFLENRLDFSNIDINMIKGLITPAISIAALGMVESLLCGASAGNLKGEKMNADRELVAQGIGNIIIPFFGGVPATAAIARTSVAIKSGGQTRLTGIIHAIGLIASM
ncbi:MAG: SulP family inorganic anion transporter, partial [Oscillospiraceae bacterium]